jgi:serine kinase
MDEQEAEQSSNDTSYLQIGELEKYKNEKEEKMFRDSVGNLYSNFFYTDRAIMARNKIILKETLGKGTYSKVKQAFDFAKYRQLAVKIIDRSKAPKDFQEKFLPRELDIWPKVNHPNVIRMYDCIVHGDKIYMLLEYAKGGDMLNYIQNIKGPVNDKDCKLWMRQICSAVSYLHQMNIIHRDLKLENLLLDANRNIKLCDFGFSKDLNQLTGVDELSRTYCGSKAYASPG